jgi:hypothetical protein
MVRTFGKHAHVFDAAFYTKVAVASFALGGCMEMFMIKTGFYDKVLHIEAERRYNAAQRSERGG